MAEISRRDFLKLAGTGLFWLWGIGPLQKIESVFDSARVSEAQAGQSVDLAVIFSRHATSKEDMPNDGNIWPAETRKAVYSMQYDILGADTVCFGTAYSNLNERLPVTEMKNYRRDRNPGDPLYVVSADMSIGLYHPADCKQTELADAVFHALTETDSAFGEGSPAGVTQNLTDRLLRLYGMELGAGLGVLGTALGVYISSLMREKKEQGGISPESIKTGKIDIALSAIAGALYAARTASTGMIASIDKKTSPELSRTYGQMIDAVLAPFSDEQTYLSIRNCRVALAVIDRSKILSEERKRTGAAPYVRAGVVFGSGHTFGEYPAQHTALCWKEPIEQTEARMVGVMKRVARQIINTIKDKTPDIPADLVYLSLRRLLGEYDVYEIPQQTDSRISYSMDEFSIPIGSVDRMLQNLMKEKYGDFGK